MTLILKMIVGCAMIFLIQIFADTQNYFIASLLPLFPVFSLIAAYTVGSQRGIADLKEAISFGMLSMIAYLAYLITVRICIEKYSLKDSMVLGIISWAVIAALLILIKKSVS